MFYEGDKGKGDKGNVGDKGSKGDKGKGDKGDVGDKGSKGDEGRVGNLSTYTMLHGVLNSV